MKLINKIYIGLAVGLATAHTVVISSAYHNNYSIIININHFGEAHIELALALIFLLLTLYKFFKIIFTGEW